MIEIKVPGTEWFNEQTQEFVTVEETTLRLEHSLVSLAKWEAKWHKPFLSIGELYEKDQITGEMMTDYINCMSLDGDIPEDTLRSLSQSAVDTINQYIADPMTATWFSGNQGSGDREIVTAEIIYYWMISLNIPIECEHWHLNRLLTLIRVFNEKNKKPTKMSRKEIMQRNAQLNAARRKALNSRG